MAVPLLIVLVLALLAEGAVRARQWFKFGTAGSLESLYHTDEAIGLRVLRPGMRLSGISINGQGFRGPEITQPKLPGTLRLAFLGASTTFCAEVSADGLAWPEMVSRHLGEHFETRVDFVNGGVPGYSVAASSKNLRHRVREFQPDVIVIYHATNDLTGEMRDLARAAGLVRDRPALSQWLERRSLLWELAVKNVRVLLAQRAEAASPRLQVSDAQLASGFRADLTRLVREARATGARVAVATFSTHLRAGQSAEEQKRALVSALVYMPFMDFEGLLAGYVAYNRAIAEVAAAEGALLIGGEDEIPGDPDHFVDTVHFTDRGSAAMARRVASALSADVAVQERVGRP